MKTIKKEMPLTPNLLNRMKVHFFNLNPKLLPLKEKAKKLVEMPLALVEVGKSIKNVVLRNKPGNMIFSCTKKVIEGFLLVEFN